MDLIGIDRNRTFTREELCRRFGYNPEEMPDKTPDQREARRTEERNRNAFFRKHFLRKNLPAVQVGNTYEVSGELYNAWALSNSRLCHDDDA